MVKLPEGETPRSATPSRLPKREGGGAIELGVTAVLYVIVAAGGLALSRSSSLTSPLLPIVLLSGAGLAVLAIAVRRPSIAFGVALLLVPPSFAFGTGAETVLLIPLALIIGRQESSRTVWSWLIAGVLSAGAAGTAFVWRRSFGAPFLGLLPTTGPEWAVGILNFVTLIGLPLALLFIVGINAGHRRRHLDELTERAEGLQRERAQQVSIARAAERERIARELHDVIAHSLTVMISLSDGALASEAHHPEQARQAVTRIGETGRSTLAEVRRLLGTVRDGSEPALSSVTSRDVTQLVAGFREAGLPVRLSVKGTLPSLAAVELTVYRIVQESLTNVLRHGRDVRSVTVRIDVADDQVRILVEDVSQPVPPVTDPGRGVVGIKERVAFFGGTAEAGPRPGGGWRVDAQFPLSQD